MMTSELQASADLSLLIEGRHYNPHHFLGLHDGVIRLWRPGAEKIFVEIKGQIAEATKVGNQGLFLFRPSEKIEPTDYQVYHSSGLLSQDPYVFLPAIGEMDLFLFNKGCHYELYRVLGANEKLIQGKAGTQFAVWAPNAVSISLVGDFNHWDGRVNPMRSLGQSGIWELFVPGVKEGEKYKFEIRTREGYIRLKSDPFAVYSELRPKTASIVFDLNKHEWGDREWIEGRKKLKLNRPINVYEVHLGSWRDYGKEFPNFRQLAVDLSQYCKKMGFTHVELMPVMEHPLDESWGYQVTGFYSVTSRFGTPADFQFFVDHLHKEGIGVILDWVPAHFPMDDFSLNRFDGTCLFEHEDPRKGVHPHWNTAIFNYGRKEVSNFLIANALFWLEQMHVDGLRVDAVASLLFLDYGRKEGEWIPNPDGSNFNVEAIEFLKALNGIVHERLPGVLMIAEESSSYTGVTHRDGLGFDLKWNMGWMNDTLRYFSKDPLYRKFHQNELTFSLLYAFSERFMNVFSHDEVVHGKGSLLNKMPGTDWQKFAGLRLLYSYLMAHPGKKLSFMGSEVGQWKEWDCKGWIDWNLLQYPHHQGIFEMVADLNHFYLNTPALWENDFDWNGFEWIDFSDSDRSVISYLRKGKTSLHAVVHHFTPEYWPQYEIRFSLAKKVREVFNSDHEKYGGSHKLNPAIECTPTGFVIGLAPLSTSIFEINTIYQK